MKHQKNSKKGSGMKIQKGSKSVKKIILVIVFMTFSVCMTQGQATADDGDVILRTQAQVDAFNHSSISGYLDINNGSTDFITNLNGLSSLTRLDGILSINSISLLTSLSGLDNLTSIGSNFILLKNPSLKGRHLIYV